MASLSFTAHVSVAGDDEADASLGEPRHRLVSRPVQIPSLVAIPSHVAERTNRFCQVHTVDIGWLEKDRHKHFPELMGYLAL